jgi:hypothetical protein
MAKSKEVRAVLEEIGVNARLTNRGNGYVLLALAPEDVDKVKAVLPIYGIGVGFDYNSGTCTYQIG